jgi:hypothetical protein
MNQDLSMILSLRRVLESAEEGMGISQSMVRELGVASPPGSSAARMLLLGFPLTKALRPLIQGKSEEASILASLIVSVPRSSASLVGKNGEALAMTLERWVEARESTRQEHQVMTFRSLLTSGVLGAVTSMTASLGPVVGNLGFTGSTPASNPSAMLAAAAAMTAIGSGMLGYFMSGRRFYLNVATAIAVFATVSYLVSPLASFASAGLWGVK